MYGKYFLKYFLLQARMELSYLNNFRQHGTLNSNHPPFNNTSQRLSSSPPEMSQLANTPTDLSIQSSNPSHLPSQDCIQNEDLSELDRTPLELSRNIPLELHTQSISQTLEFSRHASSPPKLARIDSISPDIPSVDPSSSATVKVESIPPFSCEEAINRLNVEIPMDTSPEDASKHSNKPSSCPPKAQILSNKVPCIPKIIATTTRVTVNPPTSSPIARVPSTSPQSIMADRVSSVSLLSSPTPRVPSVPLLSTPTTMVPSASPISFHSTLSLSSPTNGELNATPLSPLTNRVPNTSSIRSNSVADIASSLPTHVPSIQPILPSRVPNTSPSLSAQVPSTPPSTSTTLSKQVREEEE